MSYINKEKFIEYCDHNKIVVYSDTENNETFDIITLIENFNEELTKKEIRQQFHQEILREIKLYHNVHNMTDTALADHINRIIFSKDGINFIKEYIKLQGEDY